MDTSAAEKLIKHFEGYRAAAYRCPAGYPTVGYGTTRYFGKNKVKLGDFVNREHAEGLLNYDLMRAVIDAVMICPSLLTADHDKICAIADFVYNLGSGRLKYSTLRRKINGGNWQDVPKQLRRWVWSGGRRLRGLQRRREAEIRLWQKSN